MKIDKTLLLTNVQHNAIIFPLDSFAQRLNSSNTVGTLNSHFENMWQQRIVKSSSQRSEKNYHLKLKPVFNFKWITPWLRHRHRHKVSAEVMGKLGYLCPAKQIWRYYPTPRTVFEKGTCVEWETFQSKVKRDALTAFSRQLYPDIVGQLEPHMALDFLLFGPAHLKSSQGLFYDYLGLERRRMVSGTAETSFVNTNRFFSSSWYRYFKLARLMKRPLLEPSLKKEEREKMIAFFRLLLFRFTHPHFEEFNRSLFYLPFWQFFKEFCGLPLVSNQVARINQQFNSLSYLFLRKNWRKNYKIKRKLLVSLHKVTFCLQRLNQVFKKSIASVLLPILENIEYRFNFFVLLKKDPWFTPFLIAYQLGWSNRLFSFLQNEYFVHVTNDYRYIFESHKKVELMRIMTSQIKSKLRLTRFEARSLQLGRWYQFLKLILRRFKTIAAFWRYQNKKLTQKERYFFKRTFVPNWSKAASSKTSKQWAKGLWVLRSAGQIHIDRKRLLEHQPVITQALFSSEFLRTYSLTSLKQFLRVKPVAVKWKCWWASRSPLLPLMQVLRSPRRLTGFKKVTTNGNVSTLYKAYLKQFKRHGSFFTRFTQKQPQYHWVTKDHLQQYLAAHSNIVRIKLKANSFCKKNCATHGYRRHKSQCMKNQRLVRRYRPLSPDILKRQGNKYVVYSKKRKAYTIISKKYIKSYINKNTISPKSLLPSLFVNPYFEPGPLLPFKIYYRIPAGLSYKIRLRKKRQQVIKKSDLKKYRRHRVCTPLIRKFKTSDLGIAVKNRKIRKVRRVLMPRIVQTTKKSLVKTTTPLYTQPHRSDFFSRKMHQKKQLRKVRLLRFLNWLRRVQFMRKVQKTTLPKFQMELTLLNHWFGLRLLKSFTKVKKQKILKLIFFKKKKNLQQLFFKKIKNRKKFQQLFFANGKNWKKLRLSLLRTRFFIKRQLYNKWLTTCIKVKLKEHLKELKQINKAKIFKAQTRPSNTKNYIFKERFFKKVGSRRKLTKMERFLFLIKNRKNKEFTPEILSNSFCKRSKKFLQKDFLRVKPQLSLSKKIFVKAKYSINTDNINLKNYLSGLVNRKSLKQKFKTLNLGRWELKEKLVERKILLNTYNRICAPLNRIVTHQTKKEKTKILKRIQTRIRKVSKRIFKFFKRFRRRPKFKRLYKRINSRMRYHRRQKFRFPWRKKPFWLTLARIKNSWRTLSTSKNLVSKRTLFSKNKLNNALLPETVLRRKLSNPNFSLTPVRWQQAASQKFKVVQSKQNIMRPRHRGASERRKWKSHPRRLTSQYRKPTRSVAHLQFKTRPPFSRSRLGRSTRIASRSKQVLAINKFGHNLFSKQWARLRFKRWSKEGLLPDNWNKQYIEHGRPWPYPRFLRRFRRKGFVKDCFGKARTIKQVAWLQGLIESRAIQSRYYKHVSRLRRLSSKKFTANIRKYQSFIMLPKKSRYPKRRRRWWRMRKLNNNLFATYFNFRTYRQLRTALNKRKKITIKQTSSLQYQLQKWDNRLGLIAHHLNLAPTLRWAHFFVRCGVFWINGKQITDPTYVVQPGTYLYIDPNRLKGLRGYFNQDRLKWKAHWPKHARIAFHPTIGSNFEVFSKLNTVLYKGLPVSADLPSGAQFQTYRFDLVRLLTHHF